MENKKNKVIPYKKKKTMNPWILVCALVFIYLIVYFCVFSFGGRVSVYEVGEGSTLSKYNSRYTALVIRDEQVVNAADSGYVNFFVGDSSRIYVGENIYVSDTSGTLAQKLQEASGSLAVLDEKNLSDLRNSIYDFDTSFNTQNFYDVYTFKYKLESDLTNLTNNAAFAGISGSLSGTDYKTYTADSTGIILHNTDGFEGKTYEDIESSDFKKTNYRKNIIKSNSYIESGQPVYKVVKDDTWNLIIQVDDPSAFDNVDYVDIEFLKDNIKTSCDFKLYTKAGNTYGVMTITRYMARYLSDRYLQIRIEGDTEQGLKIPKTAAAEKQFYEIPADYLVQGGNSQEYGFNLMTGSKNSETSVEFITPTIAYKTDEYVYVCTEDGLLSANDVLVKSDSGETFTVSKKENKYAVYSIESGYAALKAIDILGENNEYYIIDSSSYNGIRLYDRIIENFSSVKAGEEIYK